MSIKIIESTAKVILTSEGKVSGVLDTKGNKYDADCVIIATGGMSYPVTGSNGDGYELAKELGHTIREGHERVDSTFRKKSSSFSNSS